MGLKSALHRYHKKRNFSLTTEPYGRAVSASKKRLYIIQKHAASHLHYDFRLELSGVLKSWAVPKGPSLDPTIKRLAVHVEDHPMEYGSFEGIIPPGQYGGGVVMLWDKGEWIPQDKDPRLAYQKGSLTFLLKGKKLKGLWKLVRIKKDPKNWLLFKISDQYSKKDDNYNVLQKKPKSVISHLSLEGIAKQFESKEIKVSRKSNKINESKQNKKKVKKNFPKIIHPELAFLVNEPPVDKEWLHEIKLDGYRIIVFINNNKIKFITRNQKDCTAKFPYHVAALKKLKLKSAILDGELVALNEKQHSDFQLLQNSISNQDTSKLVYYIFDLIYYDGEDFTHLSLLERKKKLHHIISSTKGPIRYSEHIIGNGTFLFKKACQLGLEGIVSKQVDSHYIQKRDRQWLKIKCTHRQEFIVVGFTQPSGQRNHFGSLLLAVYSKNKKMQYCGNVGTGFTQSSLIDMAKLLKRYKTNQQPFSPPKGFGKISWVKSKIVIEVEFTEWTQEGLLRHPSFKGIRFGKKPEDVVQEGVKI